MTRRELLVCLCAFPAFAQDTTIRVTTRLVQVSVLVLDNKGRPVEGLAKDDFVLLDKGKEQKIAEFAVESRNRKNSPPRLQPGLFTNYWEIAPRGMTPNATIILFDALNTSFADQAYARRQMLKCLESLQGGDRIAIYSLSRNLRVLHEFTDDTTALIRAVSRLKGHVSPELQASTEQPEPVGDERIDEFLEESNRRITDYYTINRVKTTLAAMEGIAYHVARLPGRKNLIWISGSFPAWIGMDEPPMSATGRVFTGERRTFSDEIEHAVRLLNNSNIAIYPVDARGLIPDPTFSAVSKGSANPRTAGRKSPMQSIALTHDTMHMLADRTGGRPFYNSNDIAGALRKTLDESHVSYLLGFYPAHNEWNGKWREIKVRVPKPGVHVRHRIGYIAFEDKKAPTEKERKLALDETLRSPLEATELVLAARLGTTGAPPDKIHIVARISPRDVTLTKQDDKWHGGFDIAYLLVGASGEPAKLTSDGMDFTLNKDQYVRVQKEGFILRKTLDLIPKTERLKLVVRDRPSGSLGSLNMALTGVPQVQPAQEKKQ